MNAIDLSTYHRLYAFSDYQSMKAALPYMRNVMLAKRLDELEETDARKFVSRLSGSGYKNYLAPLYHVAPRYTATDSFISALQMLYKRNGYSAKYIVVERK